ERDQAGEHAPPEDELVGDPPGAGAPSDERLHEEVAGDESRQREGVAPEPPLPPERLPPPPVQPGGRRASQPDEVAVDDREDREQRPEQVADQRGVEPPQVAAAEHGDRDCDRDGEQSPRRRASIDRRQSWHAPPHGSASVHPRTNPAVALPVLMTPEGRRHVRGPGAKLARLGAWWTEGRANYGSGFHPFGVARASWGFVVRPRRGRAMRRGAGRGAPPVGPRSPWLMPWPRGAGPGPCSRSSASLRRPSRSRP